MRWKSRASSSSKKRRRPAATGDTINPDTRAFLNDTGNRWLSKPFGIEQIAYAINDVLNQEAVAA